MGTASHAVELCLCVQHPASGTILSVDGMADAEYGMVLCAVEVDVWIDEFSTLLRYHRIV